MLASAVVIVLNDDEQENPAQQNNNELDAFAWVSVKDIMNKLSEETEKYLVNTYREANLAAGIKLRGLQVFKEILSNLNKEKTEPEQTQIEKFTKSPILSPLSCPPRPQD